MPKDKQNGNNGNNENSINDNESLHAENGSFVEDSFEVDDENNIIEDDVEQVMNIDAEFGRNMVDGQAQDYRTKTSMTANAEYSLLIIEDFGVPFFEDLPQSSALRKLGIKTEADLLASDSKEKEVVAAKASMLPKELKLETALKALNLIKISDEVPHKFDEIAYKTEKVNQKAVVALLNHFGISNEKIEDLKKASIPEATRTLDLYCGNENVKKAKEFMLTKTTSPLKVDEFIREYLGYGNLGNLTDEQREAFENFSAKRAYNKEDLELAVNVLNGPDIDKDKLYATLAMAKERVEMMAAQMTIDKSSPVNKDLKNSYDKLVEVMEKKGISKNDFENMVNQFDFKKQEENTKLVENAIKNIENNKILSTSTDEIIDSFYARIGQAFHAEKSDKGDDLNTTNLREFTNIMRDLNSYKNLVNDSKDKNEIDKSLVDITISKFLKFGETKGIDKEIILKLANANEKDIAEKEINQPVDKDKELENEAASFRKHLTPEEQAIIDEAVREDRGPIDEEPFIGDEAPELQREAEVEVNNTH